MTVKPNITQVSLSVPALPSGKMASKSCVSCGRQCYGQVFSTLRTCHGVSTVVSFGQRSSGAALPWINILKMDTVHKLLVKLVLQRKSLI